MLVKIQEERHRRKFAGKLKMQPRKWRELRADSGPNEKIVGFIFNDFFSFKRIGLPCRDVVVRQDSVVFVVVNSIIAVSILCQQAHVLNVERKQWRQGKPIGRIKFIVAFEFQVKAGDSAKFILQEKGVLREICLCRRVAVLAGRVVSPIGVGESSGFLRYEKFV